MIKINTEIIRIHKNIEYEQVETYMYEIEKYLKLVRIEYSSETLKKGLEAKF